MQMCSAAGTTSPFVCILSIPGLGKYDWHCEEVVGLSYTCSEKTGFVYFAQNRCRTEDMWQHYFLKVAIPTIAESNKAYAM